VRTRLPDAPDRPVAATASCRAEGAATAAARDDDDDDETVVARRDVAAADVVCGGGVALRRAAVVTAVAGSWRRSRTPEGCARAQAAYDMPR